MKEQDIPKETKAMEKAEASRKAAVETLANLKSLFDQISESLAILAGLVKANTARIERVERQLIELGHIKEGGSIPIGITASQEVYEDLMRDYFPPEENPDFWQREKEIKEGINKLKVENESDA